MLLLMHSKAKAWRCCFSLTASIILTHGISTGWLFVLVACSGSIRRYVPFNCDFRLMTLFLPVQLIRQSLSDTMGAINDFLQAFDSAILVVIIKVCASPATSWTNEWCEMGPLILPCNNFSMFKVQPFLTYSIDSTDERQTNVA